jgi:putative ABC transport system permease protein
MLRLAISTLRARKARALLAAAAITLGVAFMSASLVLTDTIGRAYDDITTTATTGTDAVVRSDRVQTTTRDDTVVRGPVPASLLATVRTVAGVAAAEPDVTGVAQVVRADGTVLGYDRNHPTPVAMAWHANPALNPMRLVTGHAPGAGEVVVDQRSAEVGGLHVGDRVGVLTATGRGTYDVAGIATYGGAKDAAGAHVVAFAPRTAVAVLGTPGRYDAIRVAAEPGVTQQQLVTSIRAALAGTDVRHVEAVTGTTAATEDKERSQQDVGFYTIFLMSFAVVSLLVGSMVIANAFAITAAQRSRENALLRALGARRGQVTRAVVTEAAATGLMASALGVLTGIGTASLLKSLVERFGPALPDAPLTVHGRVVVTGLVVGTLVTVVASYLPARRSGRIAPVAALRESAPGAVTRSRKRAVVGTVVTGLGAAAVTMGFAGDAPGPVGMGALALFVGLVALGPVLAPAIVRVLGAPLRFAGVTGVLARENARRNPRRTAATASSLMVGLGLISFMIVLSTSARASFAALVDTGLRGDWIVSTVFGQGGMTPQVADEIDRLPETGAVSSVAFTAASVAGEPADVSATDTATIDRLLDSDLQAGRFADLGRDGIAVRYDMAESQGLAIGDPVTVVFPATGERRFTVAAIYKTAEPLGPYSIEMQTLQANGDRVADEYVFVDDAPGVSRDEASAAISRVLADYPTARVQTGAEFASDMSQSISQLLNLVNALLALAVLIALFGITNTLALSVHERTREIGLLRAVGMDRRQLRSAVRLESVVVSLFGTLVGLGTGVGAAVALMHTLRGEGLDQLAVPALPLLAVLVVGVVAGVLCATLPARRAARVDVLRALYAD